MKDFALLGHLFETPEKIRPGTRIGTPGSIGENLFKNFLQREYDSGKGSVRGEDLLGGLKESGLNGLLRLPQEARSLLLAALERHGVHREKGLSLIQGASDKDGFVRLGRLLSALKRESAGSEAGKERVIDAAQVPELEKLLLQWGLGVGEVKAVSQSAGEGRGNISLGRLRGELSGFFPHMDSEQALLSKFKEAGIHHRNRDLEGALEEAIGKDLAKGLSNPASRSSDQKVKEALAALLREKGFTPEEVKSILETMSLRDLKSTPGLRNGAWGEGAESKALLDRIMIGDSRRENQENRVKSNVPSPRPSGAAASEALDAVKVDKIRGQGGSLPGEKASLKEIEKPSLERFSGPNLDAREVQGGAKKLSDAGPIQERFPDPFPKILQKMVWMAQTGSQSSRIQLSPPELGRLDVSLLIENGHLRAHVGAESAWAKEIIETNLNQLRSQLSLVGFTVDRLEVALGLDQPGTGKEESWNSKEGQSHRRRAKRGTGGVDETQPVERAPFDPGGDTHRVNLRV